MLLAWSSLSERLLLGDRWSSSLREKSEGRNQHFHSISSSAIVRAAPLHFSFSTHTLSKGSNSEVPGQLYMQNSQLLDFYVIKDFFLNDGCLIIILVRKQCLQRMNNTYCCRFLYSSSRLRMWLDAICLNDVIVGYLV